MECRTGLLIRRGFGWPNQFTSGGRRGGTLLRAVVPALLLQAIAILVGPADGRRLGRKEFLQYQVAFLQNLHFDHARTDERHAAHIGRTPTKTPQHTRTGIDGECSHGLDGALACAPSLLLMDERTLVELGQKIKLDPVGSRHAHCHWDLRERERTRDCEIGERSGETVCRDVRQPRP